jgi:hypothetical protein
MFVAVYPWSIGIYKIRSIERRRPCTAGRAGRTVVEIATDKKTASSPASWSLFERCQSAGPLPSKWSAASTRNMK